MANRIKNGELNLLLADGIKTFGDMGSHFASETFKNVFGGEFSKWARIPFESAMHGIGLGEEGIEFGKWTTSVIDDMGAHIKSSMKSHFELFETLARDPEAFAE